MNWLTKFFRNLFAKPREWNCVCGWHGDTCSWTDGGRGVDNVGQIYYRPFSPICPTCLRRL